MKSALSEKVHVVDLRFSLPKAELEVSLITYYFNPTGRKNTKQQQAP
jgi:hypothetical protein